MRRVDVNTVDTRHCVARSSTDTSLLSTVVLSTSFEAERLHEPSRLEVESPNFGAFAADERIARREVVLDCATVAGEADAVVRGGLGVKFHRTVGLKVKGLCPVRREDL
jgi:hypothetical protein